jgi:hypothetical protein
MSGATPTVGERRAAREASSDHATNSALGRLDGRQAVRWWNGVDRIVEVKEHSGEGAAKPGHVGRGGHDALDTNTVDWSACARSRLIRSSRGNDGADVAVICQWPSSASGPNR